MHNAAINTRKTGGVHILSGFGMQASTLEDLVVSSALPPLTSRCTMLRLQQAGSKQVGTHPVRLGDARILEDLVYAVSPAEAAGLRQAVLLGGMPS
jgi:hypothetical protein